MKVKTLSLIAAAFAVTLTVTPLVAQAQDATPSRQPGKEYRQKGAWEKLGLTEEQKARMMEIRRNTREEMLKVLTPEQKEQLKAKMQERRSQAARGEGMGKGKMKGEPFASLNLTEAQKTRMKAIKDAEKQQVEAILTPAQKQQLQEMKQKMEMRRQQRQNNSN
ncbi:MAG: P pilus assembly/Cpx signaling pathway, periplasmic inhibitor/zinc-resistance associated protein [Nostocales cyanobacterium]|nr:MAG: P pilus assembly/Cpx signaling pathway, periplasmic inhibitor/zinc-resistance associated protein [Nostocales cyanobacterium]TAF13589.1 MAG: P pilus assembly/Cpx signaling pathway, periplasmic inhibitor/zinc-resistance associated protein [Nostocales cyanobacterium]